MNWDSLSRKLTQTYKGIAPFKVEFKTWRFPLLDGAIIDRAFPDLFHPNRIALCQQKRLKYQSSKPIGDFHVFRLTALNRVFRAKVST